MWIVISLSLEIFLKTLISTIMMKKLYSDVVGKCLTPFINKVDKTEYVEFNGKQYEKAKLEEALKLIEQSS